jgi:hypothetical protein
MYKIGDSVTIIAGIYNGRPALIRADNGDGTYLVTLTDTPGPNDVTIRKIRPEQMERS